MFNGIPSPKTYLSTMSSLCVYLCHTVYFFVVWMLLAVWHIAPRFIPLKNSRQ